MTPRLDSSQTTWATGTAKAAGGTVGQAGSRGCPAPGTWGVGG
jgi:hypothetical protein